MALLAFFDGACEPVNPGGTASYGIVVFNGVEKIFEDARIVEPLTGRASDTSNNLAEYAGFAAVLDYLLEQRRDDEPATICGDSKLAIEQMSGRWAIRRGMYVALAQQCLAKMQSFRLRPQLEWIPRERNTIADVLSKTALTRIGIASRQWR